MGDQTPEPNRPVEECDCEEDNPDRRIHWQIFIATLVGMVLVAVATIGLLQVIQASHREDEISQRARYQACLDIENDATRLVCINRGR